MCFPLCFFLFLEKTANYNMESSIVLVKLVEENTTVVLTNWYEGNAGFHFLNDVRNKLLFGNVGHGDDRSDRWF